ncbi:MAG: phosphatidylserine decarboxylase family protein [Desulfobacteraceae bacterium]
MPKPSVTENRIHNRLPVAREGLPFIAAGAALTLVLSLLALVVSSALAGLITLFVAWFFRDPGRTPPVYDHAVLSPADGKVIAIKQKDENESLLHIPCLEISIFMTIFNVHINRMLAGGRIQSVDYRPGRFFSANLDKASEENEQNRIIMATSDGVRLGVVQVAGLIARRIACWVKEGDQVAPGQRFGLIRFGSRLDVYVPLDTKINVRAGDKVKAGESILAYL